MLWRAVSIVDAALEMKEELLVIHEVSKVLERPLDLPGTIVYILRLLSELRGLNFGRVTLPNEATSTLEVRFSYGLPVENLKRGQFSVGFNEGVTGYVMRTGAVGLVQDIDREPLFIQRISVKSDTLPEKIAFIAVPILESGVPIGVLSVQRDATLTRPFDNDISLLKITAAAIGQVIRIHKFVLEQTRHLVNENQALRNDIMVGEMLTNSRSHGIIGRSRVLMDAVHQANQVARSDAPVMLLGESGTGKEKFARMIHQQSDRSEKPFICINCAAIPSELLESELFGYEKGSFTSAQKRKDGKIVLADGGTLFLDEIGDMPLSLQSKLLRVLQEKVVDPLGSTQGVPVNFRLISATHKNLMESVNNGRFRLDLFYRMNVVPIYLPPIRERTGDMRLLALHFLNELNHQYSSNVVLANEALDMMENYNWPGNIRQLQNVLERAILMVDSETISSDQIQAILKEESSINPSLSLGAADDEHRPEVAGAPGRATRQYEWVTADDADSIIQALRATGGNKTAAARKLNMSLRQINYRIKKLGLKVELSSSGGH